MNNNSKLRLSEQEAQILHDICFVRMKVLKLLDTTFASVSSEQIPIHEEISITSARMVVIVFDFFHSVFSGNVEAVKRQVAMHKNMSPTSLNVQLSGDYYDEVIRDYKNLMNELMSRYGYTVEDVLRLHSNIKLFIKSQKTPPARILYIADCHFYHDRICHEMDQRGFSGYEEMNEHMIAQWNKKVTNKDDVYVIGDFSIAKSDATEKLLKQLKGKLHLILGNHDRFVEGHKHSSEQASEQSPDYKTDHQSSNQKNELKNDRKTKRSNERCREQFWFRSIEHYQEIHDNGRTVILSHYPLFCYKGQYRKDEQGRALTYMLYGHVHNTQDEVLVNRFIMETRKTLVQSRHADEPEPIPCKMINCFCMFSDYQPMTLDEWIEIDKKRRDRMILGCDIGG